MNLSYLIIFSLVVFLSVLLGGKKYRSTALYALAIGGVVNANFFHAGNYSIDCFGLPFGIDSIIYTLFIFCVIVMFLKEDKKSAYILAASSIIAIMFSAFMQLFAELFSNGSSTEIWLDFLSFAVSSLASIVAVVVMLEVLNLLKGKINQYLLLTIGVFIAIFVNTLLYYPIILLINGMPSNIWILVLTSFLGKFIGLCCALITLKLINLYDKKALKKSSKNENN